MIARIQPGLLSGTLEVPSSKSFAHRLLIASALADRPSVVRMNADNADIRATARCLNALGADIESTEGGYTVVPVTAGKGDGQLFCGESGSTLRFLLPVAAALGKTARFTGEGRLPMRPNDILTDALRAHSVECDASLLPINISGQLRGGTYEIAGNVSSQYITGLLMSLPLCGEDSDIILTTKLESAPYVVMTIEVLKQFGIRIDVHENGWHIPGGQKYHSPESTVAEGDWSSAAFWVTANNIGSKIELTGILDDSSQGDKAIVPFLEQLGGDIDVSETPDLVPTLAVGAAMYNGVTRFVGAGRLRIKESDRLTAVKNMLTALGGRAEDTEDTLTVFGGTPLHGGTVDGCNDHRIVMAAAIAATVASGETVITDAQAVSKSYPAFFDHFNAMGGHADVEPDR